MTLLNVFYALPNVLARLARRRNMSTDRTVTTLPAGIALIAGEASGLLDVWASSPSGFYACCGLRTGGHVAHRREGRLDNHGFSGLRLRTTRGRDATRSPTAMRGNCSTEDEPGYRQLLHGLSSPPRVYACLRVIRQRPPEKAQPRDASSVPTE
jgi:hypothetical protein